MEQVSDDDDLVVLEPVELTATGLHGRVLFRAGTDAGSVWFCLGDRLLATPCKDDPQPVGASCLGPLTELHIQRLQALGVVDIALAAAVRAWIYR